MKTIASGVDPEKLTFLEPNQTGYGISLYKNLQKTEPSVPLSSAFPRQELGDSGTRILHGIITQEPNPQLQGIEGIRVYDRMRLGDGTVRAALMACTLPIRRAEWFVKEANETSQAKEQAEFVRHAIFDWIEDQTFDDILRQALLMTAFGVMLFEKVYGTYEDPGTKKTYVTLKKLAPRLPQSILMWELAEDHTFGIQQIRQDGVLAQIPGSKLLIFVNEREGDNWWGTSLLRAAYQHWYRKTNLYKIDGIAAERQGLGIPFFKMPVGYTDADMKTVETILSNLRANEKAYVAYPNTYEFGFADMGGKTTHNMQPAIEHHNKEILQSVLAQFLELGTASKDHGSRALSQDHSDLFLKSMEAIAMTFISVMNKDLVKELVDLNFNDVKDYPVLDFGGVAKTDAAALATAYGAMVTAGAITPTDDDQQYIRALMGLPERTEKQIEEAADNEPDSETLIEEGNIDDDSTAQPEQTPEEAAGDAEKQDKQQTKPKPGAKTSNPQKPEKPVPAQAHEHNFKRRFSTNGKFMSWRPLTAAEQKVNWTKVQDEMNTLEKDFTTQATAMLTEAKNRFMAKLHTALATGNAQAIMGITIDFQDQYAQLLRAAMTEAYTTGKANASREIKKDPKSSSAESVQNIALLAAIIAAKAATDLEAAAKLSTANALKTEATPLQAAGKIDANMDEAIEKSIANTANVIVAQSMNDGRNDTFDENSESIYGLQRSEILDQRTCNFCISMDGRIVEPGDGWGEQGAFHSSCRGIWVAIMLDESNPPAIDGVPSNVADYYGGEVNSVVQPRTPIPKPGSLAEQYVKAHPAK